MYVEYGDMPKVTTVSWAPFIYFPSAHGPFGNVCQAMQLTKFKYKY